jgi:uncharacterized protein (DUF2141 family)
MARYYFIILSVFLVTSCAQVGTISGGKKDIIAPQIKKSSLKDKTVNFKDTSVSIEFNEFIVLNKPTENIFLMPNDAALVSSIKKKTLTISWKRELKENTSYSIYLNKAVKDVTEGNDSLMKLTFSTGNILDSLQIFVSCFDAFSKQKLSNIVVGLYDSLNAEKPRYFAKSNQLGLSAFSTLKAGDYFVKSFSDDNNDLIIQKTEKQGWEFTEINILERKNDTLKSVLSIPKNSDKIKNARILPPGLIGIHMPEEKQAAKLFLDSMEINLSAIFPVSRTNKDSVLISIGTTNSNPLKLIIQTDTLSFRYSEKDRTSKIKPRYIENLSAAEKLIEFEVNDKIKNIDKEKIKILNSKDSSRILFDSEILFNKLRLKIRNTSSNEFLIELMEGAITGESTMQNSSLKQTIKVKTEKELGKLLVHLSENINSGIIELVQKEKVITALQTNESTSDYIFDNLLPGEYSFRIILDDNKNEKWDPIDVKQQKQAEGVLYFNTPVKARANWDVETTLEINN